MENEEKTKTIEGPSQKEERTAQEPTTKSKKETLRDFRTAVQEEERRQEIASNDPGGAPKPATEQPPRTLNPMDRKVIRCASCGHFLCEIIADHAYVRSICRQADCKAQNEVTVESAGRKSTVHIEITPKEVRQMGTMRA